VAPYNFVIDGVFSGPPSVFTPQPRHSPRGSPLRPSKFRNVVMNILARRSKAGLASLALSSALTAACGASLPAAAAQSTSSSASPCSVAGDRLRSMTASPGDDAFVDRTLTWAAEDAKDSHALAGRSLRLTGACANDVSGYNLGEAVLATGEGFTFSLSYEIKSSEIAKKVTMPDAVKEAPEIFDGGRFVMATKVQAVRISDDLYFDYLGLWSSSGTSVVASFRTSEKGGATMPRVLFRSSAPIKSISFFPSPDSPAGTISLAQIVDPESVQLSTYRWNHEAWFAGLH